MGIWSRVSRYLWQEPEAGGSSQWSRVSNAARAIARRRRDAAGVPEYLRTFVRCAVIGFAATILTAEIIDVRLTTPVDAAEPYSSCPAQCQAQLDRCLTTGPASCLALLNTANTACFNALTACQSRCPATGSTRSLCLNECLLARANCICGARNNFVSCSGMCNTQNANCLRLCSR